MKKSIGNIFAVSEGIFRFGQLREGGEKIFTRSFVA